MEQWLKEHGFREREENVYCRSLDITSLNKEEYVSLKKLGVSNQLGTVVQSLTITVTVVSYGEAESGYQCRMTVKRGNNSFSASHDEAIAYDSPKQAITVTSTILFKELWECVKQVSKLAKRKVDFAVEE